jgi:hypothetical protein
MVSLDLIGKHDGFILIHNSSNHDMSEDEKRITSYREKINEYESKLENGKNWEYYKKVVNPYELVYTQKKYKNFPESICIKHPLSRSYFKMIEMLQVFHFFDSFSISQELFFFLSYEELGIPQGAILIPLLVLGGYQQLTTFFVKTGAFRVVTLKQLWNNQFKQEVIILAAAAFVFGVSHFFLFPSEIYVVLLIISVTVFRIWKRKIE